MISRSYHQMLVSHELGGAGMVALRLAEHLRRDQQPCQVWVPGDGPAQREAQRLGLSVNHFGLSAARSQWRLRAAWANWQMARELRGCGQGLIHVHGVLHYGLLSWGLKFAGHKRVVHVQIEEDADGLRWALRSPPELVITCARFLVDQVREALPPDQQDRQRIVAVPNAVDVERFAPCDKARAKHKVGAPAEVPLVLMLANLSPHKGQETTLRSVALLKQRGVDVACWLAGEERCGGSAFTQRLKTLICELGIGDRVRLLGQRSDAPDLLRAADFFLLPSTHEGLPLSILEAQASGVPVLAAPTAGIPEVITDGQTGFLIPAQDAAGYSDRLQMLLAQPHQARRLADSASAQVAANHNWPAYCRRVQELYQEI